MATQQTPVLACHGRYLGERAYGNVHPTAWNLCIVNYLCASQNFGQVGNLLHRQRPQEPAPPATGVEARFDDVGQRREVGPSMRVDAALRPRRGARREGDSNHVVLVDVVQA